ncbi:SIMPL domain-containing protein, partial [Oleiphilus sp. HI0066]|uniref:SIMPL domain-containing protein n=3 Tax=Oleiphilus TaxID=141450 RepID=UPI0012E757BA
MSTTIREVLLQSRLLIAAILLALISITAQASDDNVISVSATGKVNVTPDIAKFVLLVEKTAPIASKAKQLTNDSVSQLLSNFKRYNIDKDTIDSGQISVSPTYNYDDGKQSLTGYRVVRTVLFELNNLNQFESILNDITESGVTHIQS